MLLSRTQPTYITPWGWSHEPMKSTVAHATRKFYAQPAVTIAGATGKREQGRGRANGQTRPLNRICGGIGHDGCRTETAFFRRKLKSATPRAICNSNFLLAPNGAEAGFTQSHILNSVATWSTASSSSRYAVQTMLRQIKTRLRARSRSHICSYICGLISSLDMLRSLDRYIPW